MENETWKGPEGDCKHAAGLILEMRNKKEKTNLYDYEDSEKQSQENCSDQYLKTKNENFIEQKVSVNHNYHIE